MSFIKKEVFYDTLSEENRVLPYYGQLTNALSQERLYSSQAEPAAIKKTISISLCPSFLNYSFLQIENIIIKKVPQKKITGYAILLNKYKEVDVFLKAEYKKSFRDNIKRLVSRLETCFDIQYTIYFGAIEKEHYDTLMATLKTMLKKRFDQRGDTTDALKNWQHYLDTTYRFVLEKRASILVIYANEKPIQICVNHHFENILFVSVPSYNINYSKFALGNISIYKLLEWSLENGYDMVDLAYGDLDYKRRWSNHLYTFEHHILAPKNNRLAILFMTLEELIIKSKNGLKNYNIDELVKKLKSIKLKSPKTQDNDQFYLQSNQDLQVGDLVKINHFCIANNALQQAINEFLYNNKLNINGIEVLAHSNGKDFLITSQHISQKVTLKKNMINFNKNCKKQ